MNRKDKIQAEFAKHLTAIRTKKGLSIRQLAATAGLEYSHVQRIEKGKVNLALTTMVALAEGLEITLSELLEGYKIPG